MQSDTGLIKIDEASIGEFVANQDTGRLEISNSEITRLNSECDTGKATFTLVVLSFFQK